MPELPEVETTCRGIRPHLVDHRILSVELHERRLRWPVPQEIDALAGQRILGIARRAKYILMQCEAGWAIIHLGMSGSLRLCAPEVPRRKHDHIALQIDSGLQLRFHDPRRFGCWLWQAGDPADHPLLKDLGPEPLGEDFNAAYLAKACKGRSLPIKQAIMDPRLVVGVGNIYACEALFAAGIDPRKPAGKVNRPRLTALEVQIREVLQRSIDQGGTTLRDFLREDGSPGYFRQQLQVYDRAGLPCPKCSCPVNRIVLGQRSTFFCPKCQR